MSDAMPEPDVPRQTLDELRQVKVETMEVDCGEDCGGPEIGCPGHATDIAVGLSFGGYPFYYQDSLAGLSPNECLNLTDIGRLVTAAFATPSDPVLQADWAKAVRAEAVRATVKRLVYSTNPEQEINELLDYLSSPHDSNHSRNPG